MENKTWKNGIAEEIFFWDQIIGGTHPEQAWIKGFNKRIIGIDVCPGHLHKYLGRKNLDVGSGPATSLGYKFGDKKFKVTAIDPLANQYAKLFAKYDKMPTVKTQAGFAEDLPFESSTFNFVYSRNALDHCYAPVKAIQEMIRVCQKDGYVVFECNINEGLFNHYEGMHNWNFIPIDDDVIIWDANNNAVALSKAVNSTNIKVKKTGERWFLCEINA